MVAVYLASGSGDWLWLAVALCLAGGAAGLLGTKGRRLLIGLLVAVVLAYATTAVAAPYYYCDVIWKWLGLC